MAQSEQDRRVDYVEFPATDIEQIKSFYTNAFGWRFTDFGPTYVSFEDGRLTGGFTTATPAGSGGALVVIYAADLEAIETAVRSSGGTIEKEIFEFPGGRRFHFKDPSGNELAVWSDG
jgi:predicted enzyme related to lactoylglutathione lyase